MDIGLSAALAIGLVSGFRHAFEPDHVIAVSTLLHEKPRLRPALRIAAAWGAGHTTVLTACVLAVTMLRLEIDQQVATLFEFPVALLLVALGTWAVISSIRRMSMPRDTLEAIRHHRETREHVGHRPNTREHLRQPRTDIRPHSHRFSNSWRGYAVGMIHGLAGSGALLLLVAATLPTPMAGIAYTLLFGGGSILGMGLVTAGLAIPLTMTAHHPRIFNALTGLSGLASIGLGAFIAWRIILP